jgi:hypothetical protein
MAVKNSMPKKLSRLLNSRRGTAEIIGSVMFLLILLFFFTNVFLWHDRATREMDDVLSDRVNSLVNIEWKNESQDIISGRGTLYVNNTGGVDTRLSRLWITEMYRGVKQHWPVDLEDISGEELWVVAGSTIKLELIYSSPQPPEKVGQTVKLFYLWKGDTTFKILTTRGNTAACTHDFGGS